MTKSEPTTTTQKLEKGMDSGAVDASVKLQVFRSGAGICANPDCNEKIYFHQTSLGDCAHIIPRKVDSHPREDWVTTLEDRRLASNLLYLCKKHHALVDNTKLAAEYPANLLRKWRTDHEEFVANIKKKSPFFPQNVTDSLQELLKNFSDTTEKASKHAHEQIAKLLDDCTTWIGKGKILEASILLSQVQTLLPENDKSGLAQRAYILEAILAYKNEDIHQAKEILLDVIRRDGHSVPAMVEYIDICRNAEEKGDKKEEFLQIVQTLDPDNARLKVLASFEASKVKETAEADSLLPIPEGLSESEQVRFMLQKAVIFEIIENLPERNRLLAEVETAFPEHHRVYLFNAMYTINDAMKSHSLDKLKNALEYLLQQRVVAKSKAELTKREEMSWLFHEIRVRAALLVEFGIQQDLKPTTEFFFRAVLECFPDDQVYVSLGMVLDLIRLEKNDSKLLLEYLKGSTVSRDLEFVYQVFLSALPHEELYVGLDEFLKSSEQEDLCSLLKAIVQKDLEQTTKILNEQKNDPFSLAVIHYVVDPLFASSLSLKYKTLPENELIQKFLQFNTLVKAGDIEGAFTAIRISDIPLLNLPSTFLLAELSWKNSKDHFFIPAAKRCLDFEVEPSYIADFSAKLAIALHRNGDDSTALKYALEALKHAEFLGKNAPNILLLASDSLKFKGQLDDAATIFDKYPIIERSPSLLIIQAQRLLRSSISNAAQLAKENLLEAFYKMPKVDESAFVSIFSEINELIKIEPSVQEATAREGTFVKIEGLEWVYIGEKEKTLDAFHVTSPDSKLAILNKTVGEKIFWPADMFLDPEMTRTIEVIADPILYLAIRSSQSIEHFAKHGGRGVISVKVLDDDGKLNLKNIEKLLSSADKNVDDYFKVFLTQGVPFSFLAAITGDPARAIGKICSEDKGFIRCNLGNQQDIDRQLTLASRTIDGEECIIDGLAALVLAEAGLIEVVVSAIPNLTVPFSVIRFLRKVAKDVGDKGNSAGQGILSAGKFKFNPANTPRDRSFHDRLIDAANLLDSLENKILTEQQKNQGVDQGLEGVVPTSMMDAVELASGRSANLLSDDALLPIVYANTNQVIAPDNFSSISLVFSLLQRGMISQKKYLEFFALLAGYRYWLLPITVDGLIDAVFVRSSPSLVSIEAKNLDYFRLGLVCSAEYGVDPDNALRVIATFLAKIVGDDTIPEGSADDIFAYTLVRFLGKDRDRISAGALLQLVQKFIGDPAWISNLGGMKLEILKGQLSRLTSDYDPMILEMPLLMRVLKK